MVAYSIEAASAHWTDNQKLAGRIDRYRVWNTTNTKGEPGTGVRCRGNRPVCCLL